jgi:hypothetical protein
MFFSRRIVFCAPAVGLALLATATEARAQWYAAAYLGGSHTRPATVAIDRPAEGVSLEFEDVEFEERSFKSPQYYGLRFGRWFGERRRLGLEIEWIHAKAYGLTDRRYDVTGEAGAYADRIQPPAAMNALVSRYAMSHGLNFLFANVAVRSPIGQGPFTTILRAGAGPSLPHAETTFAGEEREQYEYGGFGVHAAAGVEIRVYRMISAAVEYKFTFARPEIDIAGGTGQTTALSHHLALGLAFRLSR